MRILFVSRAYPPVLGGIENQNYALSVWLAKHAEITTLANRYGKKFLPLFFPWVTLRVLFSFRQYDVLLLGDGVLAPVGWIAKCFFRRKAVVSVIHGLDITYTLDLYQKIWVGFFLHKLDGLIAVSQATKELALQHGLRSDKTFVIHNGFDLSISPRTREALASLLQRDLTGKTVLLTLGRLVKRKGVAWFLKEVFPRLPDSMLYVIAGDGAEKDALSKLIQELHLKERVFLLGRVDEPTVLLLRTSADLFIQPNIPVAGDIEGFGIAVIEAAGSGLPVIAARLEGLAEAIQDGKNGYLVPPHDAPAFERAILDHQNDRAVRGAEFASFTREHYHWSVISLRYIELLEDFVKSAHDTH